MMDKKRLIEQRCWVDKLVLGLICQPSHYVSLVVESNVFLIKSDVWINVVTCLDVSSNVTIELFIDWQFLKKKRLSY